MGGINSARRWSGDDKRLMRDDLIHLTSKGYQVSGRLFDKVQRICGNPKKRSSR